MFRWVRMQIFAYSENSDFKTLLEVECKEMFGVRPVIHDSIDDLKYVLSIFESIDFVVIDIPLDQKRSKQIEDSLILSHKKVQHIFTYGDKRAESSFFKFFRRSEIAELFEEMKRVGGSSTEIKQNWTAIPICSLVHFGSLPFDLYIRLSDQRFVKRIPAYEAIGTTLVDSLTAKGLSDLYCESKFKRDFSMMLINNMINKVDRTYSSYTLAHAAQDEVLKTTKEIIHNLGITGRVIEVCEASIERMEQDVMIRNDELSEYFQSLKQNPNLSFHFRFISLTNYIGTKLILDIYSHEAREQVNKFIYASYFCDMTLKNPGHLLHRKAEDSCALDLADQNEVNFHALKSSEIVASKDISKEIALMIRQHHGSFSGVGFPQGKSNQLLPLSKVLIVAQDLAFAILNNSEAPALDVLKRFIRENKAESLQDLLLVLEKAFSLDSIVTA